MSIFFVKMVTGEEVISHLFRKGDHVVLVDPLTLEYGEQEGRRFVFLTRYNPFIEDGTIHLDRTSIVFMRPVKIEVELYYRSSVDYCRQISDGNFIHGIKQATNWTTDMISGKTVEEIADGEFELGVGTSLTSNTVH